MDVSGIIRNNYIDWYSGVRGLVCSYVDCGVICLSVFWFSCMMSSLFCDGTTRVLFFVLFVMFYKVAGNFWFLTIE